MAAPSVLGQCEIPAHDKEEVTEHTSILIEEGYNRVSRTCRKGRPIKETATARRHGRHSPTGARRRALRLVCALCLFLVGLGLGVGIGVTISTIAPSPTTIPSTIIAGTTTISTRTTTSTIFPNTRAIDIGIWNGYNVIGSDGNHSCYSKSASFASGVRLCLRSYHDLVSDQIRRSGSWHECYDVERIWRGEYVAGRASADDVFYDVGANIGMCSVYMAATTKARVVAFEPSPANLFYLTSTFIMNKRLKDRLELHPIGLGDANVEMPIFAEPGNAGHSVIGSPVGEVGKTQPTRNALIHVRRLDDVIQPPYPKIRLMKIDVEGFETKVLIGGEKLFTSGAVRAVFFELSPFLIGQGSSRLELLNTFIRYGFDFVSERTVIQSYACQRGPHDFQNLVVIMHRKKAPMMLSPCG